MMKIVVSFVSAPHGVGAYPISAVNLRNSKNFFQQHILTEAEEPILSEKMLLFRTFIYFDMEKFWEAFLM